MINIIKNIIYHFTYRIAPGLNSFVDLSLLMLITGFMILDNIIIKRRKIK